MCSALPLIKSMLSVIVNLHGATPRKFDKLSTTQLEDIARVFSLFFAVHFLQILTNFIKIFRVRFCRLITNRCLKCSRQQHNMKRT